MRHSNRNLQHTVLEGKHERPSRDADRPSRGSRSVPCCRPRMISRSTSTSLFPTTSPSASYQQTNLVSDISGNGPDHRPEPGQPLGNKLSTGRTR